MPTYVPGKLILAKTYVGIDDPDAAVYIAAVEAADEIASPGVGALETATKVAIHSFVKGCKNDGIWPAIEASCILAGARTLAGALVPLVGAAPTNVGGLFVSGDYSRKTGLVGNGSTKYLDTNRASNAEPLNNYHASVYVSTLASSFTHFMLGGSNTEIAVVLPNVTFRARNGTRTAVATATTADASTPQFMGWSRADASTFSGRILQATTSYAVASTSVTSDATYIFAGSPGAVNGRARLAFYSIGESLNLALLDARVTNLINAFAAAIP